jgi:hypothetical protein
LHALALAPIDHNGRNFLCHGYNCSCQTTTTAIAAVHLIPHCACCLQKSTIEVIRAGAQPVVPALDDIVTARVVRINARLASLDILCVGTNPVQQRYSGIIRLRDVRATELDKVCAYGYGGWGLQLGMALLPSLCAKFPHLQAQGQGGFGGREDYIHCLCFAEQYCVAACLHRSRSTSASGRGT